MRWRRTRRSWRTPAALALGGVAGLGLVAPGFGGLHVGVSVPSVAVATATKLWVANTGTGSVLEFDVANGKEVRDVKGAKYALYNPDAMVVADKQVWVADKASDAVTAFKTANGDLVKLLEGADDHFASPTALAAADSNVFVLGRRGSTVVVVSATSHEVVAVVHGRSTGLDGGVAMAVVGQHVWVLSAWGGGALTELRGSDGHVERVVAGSAAGLDHPTSIVASGGRLYVSNGGGDHLSVLDSQTGRLLSTEGVAGVDLDEVRSMTVLDGRLWLAGYEPRGWVACLREQDLGVVRQFLYRFSYPAVFSGPRYVYVVDRIQSRVTVLVPSTARVVRVLLN